MPSRPPTAPRPPVIVNVAAAPFILNTPSTLPTRSTTAIVALAPRACASATACATTCCDIGDRQRIGACRFTTATASVASAGTAATPGEQASAHDQPCDKPC